MQFLTRLPTPRIDDAQASDLAGAAVFFPAVGLVLGVCLALIAEIFQASAEWVGALAVLIGWVWITGALHLDGLGDVADAFGAAHGQPDRFIAVLGDPHAGNFAVVAIALQVAAKLVLIAHLPPSIAPWALLLIPAWARWGTLVWSRLLVSLKPGLGARVANSVGWSAIGAWGLALIALAIIGAGPTLLAIILIPAIALYWQSRLGGITGDGLGASIEVTETALLFACVLSA